MKEKNQNPVLPKNIKQIGNVDDKFKIYMEDYVFTFLQQYSKETRGEEKIAALIGECYVIDKAQVLFINGAVRGQYTKQEDGILKFTKESFEYIDNQIENYFTGSKVVGWFYSQPGFSDYVNEGYVNYHRENFKEDYQVFFLNDPLENIGGFYKFRNNVFDNINGFIIYYERNEAMNEYMLSNKSVAINPEEEKFRAKDEKLIEMKNKSKISKNKGKMVEEQRKMANIFGSLSAVLFLVCFIMGAGLIQNDDRISDLESKLLKLDESYRYIISQVKNDNVQSVFAESSNNNLDKKEANNEENEIFTTSAESIKEEKDTTTEMTTQITQQDSTKTSSDSEFLTYKVKDGDNLESISIKFYGNRSKVQNIMELNAIDDANRIYSGMEIKLP